MLDVAEFRRRLQTWLIAGNKGQECRAVALFHLEGEQRNPRQVEPWAIDEAAREAGVDALQREILAVAEGDARGFGGTQHYALYGYFGEGSVERNAYGARITFTLSMMPAVEDTNLSHGPSEPATQAGVATQLMRHLENRERLSHGPQQAVMNVLLQENRDLRARLKWYEEQHAAFARAQESLISEQHQRNLASRKELFWEAQKERVVHMLLMLVPQAINLALKKFMPNSNVRAEEISTPLVEAFRGFIGSLKPEQFHKLMGALSGVLSGEQLAPLVSIINQFVDDEEQRKKRLQDGGAQIASSQVAENKSLPAPDPLNF